MSQRFTIEQLDKLKKDGFIRDYSLNKPLSSKTGKIVAKHFKRKNQAKNWLSLNLFAFCQERALILMEEYRFCLDRKFRSDWAILDTLAQSETKVLCLIEYEGLFSPKSGHTSIRGIHRDIEKYELAQKLGLKVIRLTALNYKELFRKLNDVL